jgi:hypothetical protein
MSLTTCSSLFPVNLRSWVKKLAEKECHLLTLNEIPNSELQKKCTIKFILRGSFLIGNWFSEPPVSTGGFS